MSIHEESWIHLRRTLPLNAMSLTQDFSSALPSPRNSTLHIRTISSLFKLAIDNCASFLNRSLNDWANDRIVFLRIASKLGHDLFSV